MALSYKAKLAEVVDKFVTLKATDRDSPCFQKRDENYNFSIRWTTKLNFTFFC